MKFARSFTALLLCVVVCPLVPLATTQVTAPARSVPSRTAPSEIALPTVDALVQQEINRQQITGAVLLIGHNGRIVHQKAFGFEAVREPTTLDTVYDLASLTKVVATTPSVMRMVEMGEIRLSDPVAHYIPEFAANGKDQITIRDLMTHYSGLRPDLDLKVAWEGREEGFRRAHDEKPIDPPGARFVYSDINFLILGEIVERLSGMSLEKYADTYVFQPLGMTHTRFQPPLTWRHNIAETLSIGDREILRGTVQDPTSQRMGGMVGHAGLFSTAGDLALYAQALIDRKGILSADIIEKMTTPQQPPNAFVQRGLGWDIDSPLSTNRGLLLPVGSFGHTGYTGTSLWIDPYTDTYIILLTNTVRPRNGGVVALRARVATAVAAALNLDVTGPGRAKLLTITGYNELESSSRHLASRNGHVLTGIDVLEADGFASLKQGKQQMTIGLLTNQTGLDAQGKRTIDVLASAPGIKLAAIFSPEHGIEGTVDTTKVGNSMDAATGVPIYSLYGGTEERRRPSVDALKNLDAVLMDVQDAGTRFYTYATTLGYLLEAAAQSNTEVVLLDRPDPITGSLVQGPISQAERANFNNYHPVPVRHGMTLGELAQFFNAERKIGAKLRVIAMQGWMRGDWFDSTGITWTNPSPNLRSVNEAALYPGVGLIELTNVSVGRGTDTPFELLGAPWIDARTFAATLNARLIAGVRFVPTNFTPVSGPYANQRCGGVNIIVTDRSLLDAPELGIELASALLKLYPNDWKMANMMTLLANRQVFDAVAAGKDPRHVAQEWQDDLQKFREMRVKYLLYK
jgi:uncharacterized protein YbbC (DUF1343 family)/CubicO group peptidase (beta-lactamase class C family)